MRSEVGEWLATCVGSPICILLLSWSLLIYQSQPSASKRRIDVFAVAILAQSLLHQLGLLLFAILTLVHPANHFGEFCSSLVWILNSTSILQELSLTSISVFATLTVRDDGPNVKKHHIKYHLASLGVISACIGVTGVLNFEPDGCVFLAQDISPKYGLYFNGLRSILAVITLLSLLAALARYTCQSSPKAELLKSVSDLSEASSKNSSSGAFDCQHHHLWGDQHQQQQQQQHSQQPSSGASYTSAGSTDSRKAWLGKRHCRDTESGHVHVVDEATGWSTIYTILFVCYGFNHLPMLVVSIRPGVLKNLCTPLNLATWLPLVKDVLLPIFLAIFDKMFCQYVAKVYTKQDHHKQLSHAAMYDPTGGIDGKFRHFEQDGEFKLQLNLNHGLKFPLGSGGDQAMVNGANLYGRLHNHHSNRVLLGMHQYGQSNLSSIENPYASVGPETSLYTSSNRLSDSKSPKLQLQQQQQRPARNLSRANSTSNGKCQGNYQGDFIQKNAGSCNDICGPKIDNLVQIEEQYGFGAARTRLKHFAKSMDEIREEAPRRNARTVGASEQPPGEFMLSAFRAGPPFVVHTPGQQHPQIQPQQRKFNTPLRRNQSFDIHPRYPRIELPLVSSRTYDVKRELAIKRSMQQSFDQNRRSEQEYKENEEVTGYETSDDESCDRESQDFDTMSSCRSRAPSCCSVTTVANDDFEFFQRKGTKELSSPGSRLLESKTSMRCFTPRIIEANHFETPINPSIKLTNNSHKNNNNNNNNHHRHNVQQNINKNNMCNLKPVIQSYQLKKKKKMSPGYSLNDLDKFNGSPVIVTSPVSKVPTLSIESLKSILRSSDISYLDNGEICRHDIGGSAPDFKKIFVTEFI